MTQTAQIDWYDTPLYYDIVFDTDTGAEADFLEAMHRRHGPGAAARGSAGGRGGRGDLAALELACGSGRLVAELAARGWRVSGFDAKEPMLDFARERLAGAGLSATLWGDRMESFRVPGRRRYDLAHCLVSTFKYLPDDAAALACLGRVAAALKPGGLFVLGLHLTDPARTRPSHERWTAARNGVEVVCNTRSWPPNPATRLEPMRTRLRVALPDGSVRRQETRWEVRAYTAGQLRALLRKCGAFRVLACHDFRHDPAEARGFDDAYPDLVLVLGRR